MSVISPLTGTSDVVLKSRLLTKQIVSQYKTDFGVDVKGYFTGLKTVDIYQCNASSLCFYYPFSLAGDGLFYADLARVYKGYYSVWKWEHEKVFQLVKTENKVLEIGCGRGYFLEKLKEKKVNAVGLDFNPDAVEYGKQHDLKIINEDIAVYAQNHPGIYDVVCAFQLFEHVNEVGRFLKDSIACLKKGGILAIGVPNNDCYIFREDPYHTLNVPPHHMLLWNPASLRYVASLFDLELVEVAVQPSVPINKSVAYRLWLQKQVGNKTVANFLHLATRFLVKQLPVFTQGPTVVAIYRKKQ
ncbi:MAG: class I SAM-dependent methyltransferase [Spirosomataceae bacterium]